MNRVILCTTGTSVAQGVRTGQDEAKKGNKDLFLQAIRERVEQVRRELPEDDAFLQRVSAETNSLRLLRVTPRDRIVLLHTETGDGLACALELARIVENTLDVQAELRLVAGLQVDDAERFRRQGIQNLFRLLDQEGPQGQQVIINVTGGFKGVVPYTALFGLLYRRPLVYLFEHSATLLTLPPAPISFDWERIGPARDAILELERQTTLPREKFFERIPGLSHDGREFFEALLEPAGDEVTLSTFGLMVVEGARQQQSPVRLSPSALQTYEQSRGLEQAQLARLIARVGEPLWRRSHMHTFHGTDLDVYKMDRTALRIAVMQTATEVLVCEIFTSHDLYERLLPGRQRSDYAGVQFRAPPAEPSQVRGNAGAHEEDPVEELLATAHRERDEARQMAGLHEEETERLRQQHASAEQRTEALAQQARLQDAQLSQARQALENLRGGLRGLEQRLDEISSREPTLLGLWKKLSLAGRK